MLRTNPDSFEYCSINSLTSRINTPAPRAIRVQRLVCFFKSLIPSGLSNSFSSIKNYNSIKNK